MSSSLKSHAEQLGRDLVFNTIRLLYPRITLENMDRVPEDGCIIVGNHSHAHGPIIGELYMPENRLIWCNAQMTDWEELPGYMYQDFWSQKPARSRWFYKLASHALTPIAHFTFNHADIIPVYRDVRLKHTIRTTVEELEKGTNILIFPECHEEHNHIVHEFQQRFVDVARFYYRKTGKCIRFVPMYIAPNLKKAYFGEPTVYQPDAPMESERIRICNYLMDSITELAVSLPKHKVIPYPNVSSKDYVYNIEGDIRS